MRRAGLLGEMHLHCQFSKMSDRRSVRPAVSEMCSCSASLSPPCSPVPNSLWGLEEQFFKIVTAVISFDVFLLAF